MRPFVPRALSADGLASIQQHRAASRLEDNARVQGYQQGQMDGQEQGFKDGEAAAREELEPRLAALEEALAERIRADSLADTLRSVLAARAEDQKRMDENCAAAIEAGLRLAFPTLIRAAEGREIAALLRQAIQERENDQLEVRAHPFTMERLRQAMQDMPAAAWSTVRMKPMPEMDSGSAEISWLNGGMVYDPNLLLDKMSRALGIDPTAPRPECDAATARNMHGPETHPSGQNSVRTYPHDPSQEPDQASVPEEPTDPAPPAPGQKAEPESRSTAAQKDDLA